jgi:hypothetical protein
MMEISSHGLKGRGKMFYPDLLVYERVLCVVASPAYLDMRDFPRLEPGGHILRNSGQNIISATLTF